MLNWKWFCFEGVLLLILGAFAVAQPSAFAEAMAILIGWVLVIAGLAAVIGGISNQSGPRSPVSFGGGLVTLIFGFLLLILPAPALATVTIIMAIFFVLCGVAELSSAFSLRSIGGTPNHFGLAFLHGLVCVLFGMLLLLTWPESYAILGLIVGINFMLSGLYLTTLGWYFKTAPSH